MSSDFVGRPRDGESSTAVPEGHIAALQSQSSEITQSESRPASTNTNHANSDPTTNQLQLQQQPQPEPSTSLYHEPTHHELLASELRPTTDSTLTIRVINSFEFRTQKSLVVKGVNLGEETVGGLMARVREAIKTAPGFKPYRNLELDTLKLYTQAHGHKTSNLIINLDHEDWILNDPNKTLLEIGAVNETEFSIFNRAAYDAFKANPEIKWDI